MYVCACMYEHVHVRHFRKCLMCMYVYIHHIALTKHVRASTLICMMTVFFPSKTSCGAFKIVGTHTYKHTYLHPSIHPSIHTYIHTLMETYCDLFMHDFQSFENASKTVPKSAENMHQATGKRAEMSGDIQNVIVQATVALAEANSCILSECIS